MNKKNFKINKSIVIWFFILLIVLFTFAIQKTLSKYVFKLEQIHSQESTAFYFESDIADVNEKSYYINNWDGESYTINFYVRNYTDSLQRTEEDISYTINTDITGDISVSVINSNGDVVTNPLQMSNSSLIKDEYSLVISPTQSLEEEQEVSVTLTIESSSPYRKSITSKITLTVNKTEDNFVSSLSESDNKEYVTLNLQINDASQNITVKYDNTKLILDTSSSIVNEIELTQENSTNSFVLNSSQLESGLNYEIYFVKINSSDTISLGTDIIVE